MNGTERIKALLNGEKTDRTPISGWFHVPGKDRDVEIFTNETIRLTDKYDWDFVKVMPNGLHIPEAYGAVVDFGADPNMPWGGIVHKYPITSHEDLTKLKPLDPKENPVLKREVEVVRRVAEHYKGVKPVIPTMFNPITWLQEMTHSTSASEILGFLAEYKDEVHQALEVLLETNLRLVDAYIEAGAAGVFYASQYANSNLIGHDLFKEINTDYDLRFFDHIKDSTWFNVLHIHGNVNLYFDDFAKYPVQAINWENVLKDAPADELTSVKLARSVFSGILITGIDQVNDFAGSRDEIKARLTERLNTIREEDPTGKIVFAPGCAFSTDDDPELFTLVKEVVQ
jgi:uroporphyrinogen decarboxylase